MDKFRVNYFQDTDDYQDQKYSCMAPCILPELHLLEEVVQFQKKKKKNGGNNRKFFFALDELHFVCQLNAS